MNQQEYLQQLQTCQILGINPVEFFGIEKGDVFTVIDPDSSMFNYSVHIDLPSITYSLFWFHCGADFTYFTLSQVMPYEFKGNSGYC